MADVIDLSTLPPWLAEALLRRPGESTPLRLTRVGAELVLEGHVTSYEAKRRIGEAARSAGVPVRNCLRVVPGVAAEPTAR